MSISNREVESINKVKSTVGPELFEHHLKLHNELAPETKKWNQLLSQDKDYICHNVIQHVKDYNEYVNNKVLEHNKTAIDLCEQNNIHYHPIKNNYVIPVPKIGELMTPEYCQCDDCKKSKTGEQIETDTAPVVEEYCQCGNEPHRELITSVLKAQPSSSILKKLKTLTISEDMIPDEYKEVFRQ